MKCCGFDRSGRFCSQCGKSLGENDPLGSLLAHLRHTQAKLLTRMKNGRPPRPSIEGDAAKSHDKFKRWGDELEALLREREQAERRKAMRRIDTSSPSKTPPE
jgi:hypothetical protein